MLSFGFVFIALGAAIFLSRYLSPDKTVSTKADNGGVAVGRDNNGVVNTGAIGSPHHPQGSIGRLVFDVIAGLCSIAGLALALFDWVLK